MSTAQIQEVISDTLAVAADVIQLEADTVAGVKSPTTLPAIVKADVAKIEADATSCWSAFKALFSKST